MLVALLSDVHDKHNHLRAALDKAKALNCQHLIYLGDFVHPATLSLMLGEWPHPLDFVLGNNEYEWEAFEALAKTRSNIRFHGYDGDIRLQERRLFFTHTPHDAISKGLNTGLYDAVFYGHTHASAAFIATDKTLMVNPGEICGRREAPGFAVYCPTSNTVTFHKL
ncbi:MAG: metallophosphoesterase family protein [Akkermansia sp.]|nr:metallophosphoesterase family protein [Akkermansia sp.]